MTIELVGIAVGIGAGLDRCDLVRTQSADSRLDRKSLEMQAELGGSLVGCLVVHALHVVSAADPASHAHATRHHGVPVAGLPRNTTRAP